MATLNRPLKILSTLDTLLNKSVEIVLIGRAALALGYSSPKEAFFSTMDVDSIISESYLPEIESNLDFWEANEKLNHILESEDLYFTHIFEEKQVIIRPQWNLNKVRLYKDKFEKIELYRPHTYDLILTKMMRNDPEDFEDISFLLDQLSEIEITELPNQVQKARVPDIPEIQELFQDSIKTLKAKHPNLSL